MRLDPSGGSRIEDGRARAVLWLAWTLVIVAVTTLPWRDATGHPHWDKVAWIPFRSGPVEAWELVANLLLFLPFGYLGWRWAARRRPPSISGRGRRGRWLRLGFPLAAGGALSVAVEFAQVFIHGRFPSTGDVVMNVLGVGVGLVVAAAWRRPRQRGGPPGAEESSREGLLSTAPDDRGDPSARR